MTRESPPSNASFSALGPWAHDARPGPQLIEIQSCRVHPHREAPSFGQQAEEASRPSRLTASPVGDTNWPGSERLSSHPMPTFTDGIGITGTRCKMESERRI